VAEPLGRLSVPRRFDLRKGKLASEQRTVALRALLDRPDRRSMGLHPVVLSLGSGLRVSGIASGPSYLDAQQLERLIEDGHAIAATATLSADAVGPICAAWIGQEFALAAEDAGAPELPFDRYQMSKIRGAGWFLLDTAAAIYGALDRWTRQTFVAAIDRGSRELAMLVSWVAPNRDETRAALFITSDEDQRRRSLAWWARLERDAGHPLPSEDDLIRRVDAACDRVFLDWLPDPSQQWVAELHDPWSAIAIAARCAERLGAAVDPMPEDPSRSPVAGAIRIAREAAVRGRPASHAEVEPTRIALIEQVHRRWQDARISARLHPHALHAVESALRGAERATDDTHLDQSLLSMEHGVAEIVYPDLIWRAIPALWSHFASLPGRAIQADRQWLMTHGGGDGVHPSFFDRELWPDGAPPAWDDHVAHFRDRLFGGSREATID